MLKGISKNFNENYNQKISLKRKDQLKNKDDVNVVEAFELYMLKNFLNIKLNTLSTKILSFWKKDFDSSLSNHIKFLYKNIENQEIYNSKFSEILEKMDIFDTQNENEENESQKNENNENYNNEQDQSEEQQEKNKQDENQNRVDAYNDLNEYSMNEQLVDTDSEKQSSKNVIQKININTIDKNYNIFTNQIDEIVIA